MASNAHPRRTSRGMLRANTLLVASLQAPWRGSIVISVANPMLFLIAIGGSALVTPSADSPPGRPGRGDVPGVLRPRHARRGVDAERHHRVGLPGRRANDAGRRLPAAVATPLEPTDILHRPHAVHGGAGRDERGGVPRRSWWRWAPRSSWLVVLDPAGGDLTGLAFATPAAAWAVTLDRSWTRSMDLFKWVVMPMYLFSGTFFPVDAAARLGSIVVR